MKKQILSIVLIFTISLSNITLAAPLTPMPYGGAVVIDRNNGCAETDFAADADTDLSRGNALINALNHVKTGNGNIDGDLGSSNQSVYVSTGTFNIGTTTINLSSTIFRIITEGDLENPTTTEDILTSNMKVSNNLHGSGKERTSIISTIHGADSFVALKPSPDSQVTDLTLSSGSSDIPDYSFPFGIAYESPMPSPYNMGTVFLKNVALNSQSDGIYFHTGAINMILNVINVTSNSGWDNIAIINGQGLIMNIYNSVFNANGVSSLTNTNYHGINDMSSGATFNIYGSIFNTAGKNNVYGVYTNHTANIFNTIFNMSLVPGNGTLYSLFAYTGGNNDSPQINISPSVTYNGITSGNVSNIAEQSYTVPTLPAEPCPHPFRTKPELSNITSTGVTDTSVTLNGKLSYDGMLNTTNLGFNYSVDNSYSNQTATSGNFITNDTFSKTITGLTCGTTYNYQAFGTNSEGTATSSNQTFTTNACPSVSANTSSGSIGSSISNNELNRIWNNIMQNVSSTTVDKFKRDLKYGMRGDDVKDLQKYLNDNKFFVALFGPGSSQNETTFFGNATKKALIKFQTANNIKPSVGYFGIKTRNFILEH